MNDNLDQQFLEKKLRDEFESTIHDRVDRLTKAKPHEITASTHFAAVSHEATLLFRDGHFYGCIALSQAVAEALVRFICQRNSFKAGNDYKTNIRKLYNRKLIDEELKLSFISIWEKRDDYHHLNSSIENDKIKLETLAYTILQNLNHIEKEVFSFNMAKGSIIPKYPKYWDIEKGYTSAYLKIEP